MKQNPFSLYDFLGYFIPGSFACYLILIIDFCKKSQILDVKSFMDSIGDVNIENAVLFLIISYLLGHFLSFTSSITVEMYANWKYDYPSKYILNLRERTYWTGAKDFHDYFWRITLWIILLPTVVLDFILGKIFGLRKFYFKSLDTDLIKFILMKVNFLLDKLGLNTKNGFESGSGNEIDFFRIIQHYTYENSKNHQTKFNNYVALYGFLRTITFSLNLLFWYLSIHIIFYAGLTLKNSIILITISIFSYVFFMGYMKFYRRYTLEGLMVLTIDDKIGIIKINT